MSGLAHYYGKAKAGLMGINHKQAEEHGKQLLVAGGTGAVLGLISAVTGGLDKKIAGFEVPVDGVASLALSVAGLATRSPELLTASVAAAGSASTRSFEAIFKKTMGAHGDIDSGMAMGFGHQQLQAGYGFGAPPQVHQSQFGDVGFGGETDPILRAAHGLAA
jgi:hypothetical protein